MATYKVGDSVKFVRGAAPGWAPYIGKTGSVTAVPGSDGYLGWDCACKFGSEECYCMFAELEPAVDPNSSWADAKLEQLKRLVREPLPPHPAEVA